MHKTTKEEFKSLFPFLMVGCTFKYWSKSFENEDKAPITGTVTSVNNSEVYARWTEKPEYGQWSINFSTAEGTYGYSLYDFKFPDGSSMYIKRTPAEVKQHKINIKIKSLDDRFKTATLNRVIAKALPFPKDKNSIRKETKIPVFHAETFNEFLERLGTARNTFPDIQEYREIS